MTQGFTGSNEGDVVGPVSATDNAIARFDTTTGKLIQNSDVLIDDTNNMSGVVSVQIDGASGDPYVEYTTTGGQFYASGIDNDDSDALKINTDTSAVTPSSGTNIWKMTSAGERTIPLQPAFLAYLGTDDLNVTGSGAVYTLGTGNTLQEPIDRGGVFTPTTGVFLCNTTGLYQLSCGIEIKGLTSAMTFGLVQIVTSNGTYRFNLMNVAAARTVAADPNFIGINGSVMADMDNADTATVQVQVDGAASDTADINGGSRNSHFSAVLLC